MAKKVEASEGTVVVEVGSTKKKGDTRGLSWLLGSTVLVTLFTFILYVVSLKFFDTAAIEYVMPAIDEWDINIPVVREIFKYLAIYLNWFSLGVFVACQIAEAYVWVWGNAVLQYLFRSKRKAPLSAGQKEYIEGHLFRLSLPILIIGLPAVIYDWACIDYVMGQRMTANLPWEFAVFLRFGLPFLLIFLQEMVFFSNRLLRDVATVFMRVDQILLDE